MVPPRSLLWLPASAVAAAEAALPSVQGSGKDKKERKEQEFVPSSSPSSAAASERKTRNYKM